MSFPAGRVKVNARGATVPHGSERHG